MQIALTVLSVISTPLNIAFNFVILSVDKFKEGYMYYFNKKILKKKKNIIYLKVYVKDYLICVFIFMRV